jgi:hypothetical protein
MVYLYRVVLFALQICFVVWILGIFLTHIGKMVLCQLAKTAVIEYILLYYIIVLKVMEFLCV